MSSGAALIVGEQLRGLRVASGIDVHPFVEGRLLILGGVTVPHDRGLEGHSDADVVAHAVTDAVLGCAGLGDIGVRFGSDDPALTDADSMELLRIAMDDVRAVGMELINVDVIIVMQEPKVGPHRDAIRERLADVLGIAPSAVTVRATTTDHLGFIGRGDGAGAFATALGMRRSAV